MNSETMYTTTLEATPNSSLSAPQIRDVEVVERNLLKFTAVVRCSGSSVGQRVSTTLDGSLLTPIEASKAGDDAVYIEDVFAKDELKGRCPLTSEASATAISLPIAVWGVCGDGEKTQARKFWIKVKVACGPDNEPEIHSPTVIEDEPPPGCSSPTTPAGE